MGTEYILRQKSDGSLTATPIPSTETEIPIGLLNPRIRMGGGEFEWNGKRVKFARYVEEGLVSMVIHVPIMMWPMKVKNVDVGEWMLTDKGKVRELYIKDVILITNQTPSKVEDVYILTKDGKVPHLTNIYDSSKICTGGIRSHDPQMISPQEIIAQLESSNANNDLANEHRLSINMVGDKPVVDFTRIFDNPAKFARDRFQWT